MMTNRTIGAVLLLVAGCVAADAQKPDTEEKTLDTVRNAVDQIGSWRNAFLGDLYKQAANGNLEAQKLSKELDQRKEKYAEWEQLEWVPTLVSHETLNLLLTGEATVKGTTVHGQEVLRFVKAPPDIASHILMEKMRWEIGDIVELYRFNHKQVANDPLISAWQTPWAWARDIYCGHNPGSKFIDLNSEKQECKEPLRSSAQVM